MFDNLIKLIIYIGITTTTFKWSHCNWEISNESYEDMDSSSVKRILKSKRRNNLLKTFRQNDEDCEDGSLKEPMQCSCDCDTCKGPEGCCQVLCPNCRHYQPNLIFIPYAYPLVVPGPPVDQQPNSVVPNITFEQTENTTIKLLATATVNDFTTNTPSTPYNMVLRNVGDSPIFSATMPTAVNARSVKRNKKSNIERVRFLLSARELQGPEQYEFYDGILNDNEPDVSDDAESEQKMKAVEVRPLLPINHFV